MSGLRMDTFSLEFAFHELQPVDPHSPDELQSPPIAVPTILDARVLQLGLAIARSVCKRTAPAELLRAQARASLAALYGCCDFSGGRLRITGTLRHLNETKRNAIAHDLGVGITYMAMQRAGYAWVGLAEDHVDPKVSDGFASRKCPDLIFDQGTGPQEYAAVEAKGSVHCGPRWALGSLKSRLKKACRDQVANVLGAESFDGTPITRGIAVGLYGHANGQAAVFGCVEAEPDERAIPSFPINSLSADTSFPEEDAPMPQIAVRHYLGALRLIGADSLATRLVKALEVRRREIEFVSAVDFPAQKQFDLRTFLGEVFVLPSPETSLQPVHPFGEDIRFAIPLKIVHLLQEMLSDDQGHLWDGRLPLPLTRLREISAKVSEPVSRSFVDYDGLALLSEKDLDRGSHETILL